MSIDFSRQIVRFLVSRPDELFSITALHSELIDRYPEWNEPAVRRENLEKFKKAFITLEADYENIHRFIFDDVPHIVWSAKTYSEVYSLVNSHKPKFISSSKYDSDFVKVDYIGTIMGFLDDNNFDFLVSDACLDGVNTPIHILIRDGHLDVIKKISAVHIIDWNKKNRVGQNMIDLARESKNCEVLEYILNSVLERTIYDMRVTIETQKQNQNKILKENVELKQINENLDKGYKTLFEEVESHKKGSVAYGFVIMYAVCVTFLLFAIK